MYMKICHVELGRHLYGGAKQVTYLVEGLANLEGFEQHLICAAGSEIASAHLPGCAIHALPYSGELDITFVFRLVKLLRVLQPDVLHIHSRRGADVWGSMAAIRTGIPTVCTRRVDNPEHRLNRFKYAPFKAVISISEGVQRVIAPLCKSGQLQNVIHSAVDLKEYACVPDKARFHAEFNIPLDHTVIANFAQLIPRKGQQDLIDAMPQVLDQFPKVTCLLFGKGKQLDAYHERIISLGLASHVRLCGFRHDVPRLLPNIDLMVHPAHAEGLGVILLQAGACGIPVISCPSGGIPEIIQHHKTGFLVPVNSPNDLASQICVALENPSLTRQTGLALYEHIKRQFSIESMTLAYADIYQSLTFK